jgi:hypothetical protein
MKTLLLEGFDDAWRNLGGVVRLFWPLLAMLVLAYGISFLMVTAWFTSNAADNLSLMAAWLIGVFIVAVYLFFVLCQGAVGWHRRVLLNEAPRWVSPLPGRRGLKYALAAFLFVLMFLVAQLIVGSLLMPLMSSLIIPMMQDIDPATLITDQFEAMWKIMLPMQIVLLLMSVVVVSGVLWLVRSWVLVFPHISIRSVQPAYGMIKDSLPAPAGLVRALLIVYFLPSLLVLIYTAIIPFRMQLLPWVSVATMVFQLAISVFSFLWGLSILSKAYAKASVGTIPYDEADHVRAV